MEWKILKPGKTTHVKILISVTSEWIQQLSKYFFKHKYGICQIFHGLDFNPTHGYKMAGKMQVAISMI